MDYHGGSQENHEQGDCLVSCFGAGGEDFIFCEISR